MKKILTESYQDIENYLRSPDLIDALEIEFGEEFYNKDSKEVVDFIVNLIYEDFETDVIPERVVVCKVVGNDVDLVSQDHTVVKYNGFYYDYAAVQYNDSFSDLITIINIPVIQQVVTSDAQINERLSTVKGYVMLGY